MIVKVDERTRPESNPPVLEVLVVLLEEVELLLLLLLVVLVGASQVQGWSKDD